MSFNKRGNRWLGKADVIVLVCILFAIYWAISTNTRPPIYPVEAFFAESPRTNFQVSPDGKWLGFLETDLDAEGNSIRGLFVRSITAGIPGPAAKKILDERDGLIKAYFWKSPSTVLVHQEIAGGYQSAIIAVDMKGDVVAANTATFEAGALRQESTLPQDPNRALISRYVQADGASALMRVDIRHGRHAQGGALAVLSTRFRDRLGDGELVVSSSNLEETLYVLRVSSDRDAGREYLLHAPTETLTKLTVDAEMIPPMALAGAAPVAYAARDGRGIDGYLTLPVGIEGKDLPCIVMPQAEPWSRDRWKYNPIVQLFANRGYCVMQINYRESIVHGRSFREPGMGQLELAMEDDIEDASKWLIETGVADANRIGIFGMDHGGYAAISGATKLKYMIKAGDSGGFKNAADKLQFYHSMIRFFDANLTFIQE
ncbi:alpha/beta hydrolase family protein [Achromobacter sp. NPDC058515]|uniref:alpha/beta hydrolase family protein n=1 Tax=Achromobacter sp. NPDC058515 TaxID=3346533 RepID=UPI00364E3D4C